MSDKGGPAFPTTKPLDYWGDPNGGMTLRDYFAGQALPAVIAAYVQGNGSCIGTDHILRNATGIALKFADAMLQERAK